MIIQRATIQGTALNALAAPPSTQYNGYVPVLSWKFTVV